MNRIKGASAPSKTGPKPLYGDNMRNRSIKTTDAQWEKVLRLGGSAWIREQIEKAIDHK